VRADDDSDESGGSDSLGSGDWRLVAVGVASPGSRSGDAVGLAAAGFAGSTAGGREGVGDGIGISTGESPIPPPWMVFCTHPPQSLGLALPVITPRIADRASASTAAMTIGRSGRRAAGIALNGLAETSTPSSSFPRRRANSCSNRLSTSCIVNKTRTPARIGRPSEFRPARRLKEHEETADFHRRYRGRGSVVRGGWGVRPRGGAVFQPVDELADQPAWRRGERGSHGIARAQRLARSPTVPGGFAHSGTNRAA
jgi:hypothetical protein